jgi:hypothetical protein
MLIVSHKKNRHYQRNVLFLNVMVRDTLVKPLAANGSYILKSASNKRPQINMSS